MISKSEVPDLLREPGGNPGKTGLGYSNWFSPVDVERTGELYREDIEIPTRRGRWQIYTREGFEIPWFHEPHDVVATGFDVNGHRYEAPHEVKPDGFVAFYSNSRTGSPETPEVFVRGDHADMDLIEEDCGTFTRRVVENPLYRNPILRLVSRRPFTTILLATGGAYMLDGLGAPLAREYVLNNNVAPTVFVVSGLAAIFSELHQDNVTPAKLLVDYLAGKGLPERATEYAYGHKARNIVRTELDLVKEEARRAEQFKRWKEAGLFPHKTTFLSFYEAVNRHGDMGEKLRDAREVIEREYGLADIPDSGSAIDDLFGKAVNAVSEPATI